MAVEKLLGESIDRNREMTPFQVVSAFLFWFHDCFLKFYENLSGQETSLTPVSQLPFDRFREHSPMETSKSKALISGVSTAQNFAEKSFDDPSLIYW